MVQNLSISAFESQALGQNGTRETESTPEAILAESISQITTTGGQCQTPEASISKKEVKSHDAAAPAAKKSPKSSPESKDKPVRKIGPDVRVIQESEIVRMVESPKFNITCIPGTSTAVINITEAVKEGIQIYRKKDNRIHGRDKDRTGNSLMTYGPQLPLSVCSVKEAKAAGIEFDRFSTDPHKDEAITDDGLVVLDGHGRMEFLFGEKDSEWPTVLAIFPTPDKSGEIHLENAFEEMNMNDTIWGSKDYILIRLADKESHDGWRFIKDLEDKELGFTIASIFATGKENAITKKTVLQSTPEQVSELFKNLVYGKALFAAAEEVFSTCKGSALLTKAIPNKIFSCWEDLTRETSLNANEATEYMVGFLKSLASASMAIRINSSVKIGDKDRDTVRKEMFTQYFTEYRGNNPIG